MGYTKDTLKGISWIGLLHFVIKGITFIRIAILARLLSPAEFGTYGVAILAFVFIEIFTETGINVFLIQEKKDINKYLDTAWIVSIIRGVLIFLIVIITSSFVSNFFHSPDSYLLLLMISIVPLLRGFINPAVILFQKELTFRKEFWFRSSIFVVDSLVSLGFVFITRQASGLIFGLIVGVVFEVLLSFILAKPVPKFIFKIQSVKEVLHKGKWLTASGVLNYIFQNGDNVVVGKILGVTPLGLYQMGYRLATIPIGESVDIISQVTFPVYSKISNDYNRLRRAFLKTSFMMFLLGLPICIALFFFAQNLVIIILGSNWLSVVPVVRVLAVFGLVQIIAVPQTTLYLAVGKQRYGTIVAFVRTFALCVTIIPLVLEFGIIGAAISAVIGSLISLPFNIYYTLKIIKNLK